MKNKKFLSLAFAIALLCTLVPTSFADNDVTITGIVNSGLSMDAGADPDDMVVSPVAAVPVTEDTAAGELTIQNNDPLGFFITVQLVASDTAATENTLAYEGGATDVELATEGGTIGFSSTQGAELANGTDYVEGVFTSDDLVYTSATGNDGQCVDGKVAIEYTLNADEEVAPLEYVGVATYTITVNP
jgi:hypothetical protein